ncbi:nuclear receptor 2c2-associated protein [Nannochloropsis gaditana CCMP526]|uniref:nuclear receptor 2c2-associated protein n=1 Tax=Nannochloropsis gaditana (strain CCMP526) TaxID=1093141 RepID=UPI00029F50B4|nr:nuclear receptor 2c2-associated protein [Nannochloropsis gaditana CCMP526]XP_005854271.1 nuclear receptor 2c2-associated protein [Nannochloropsis gaditana CCMP526]EKU22089.1 nuclear receptor 2c2-associated protein [Nannochloropsis gaditana CCMP526]EKU22191.1 nuclear receptor 2c2-associated protein [Nannochloropsis gaditana CCMP526]|eukprot:XP_005854168.1 nuclear receptor 2c2-associated protein [Nannochloropsis gaditana CCMP526]
MAFTDLSAPSTKTKVKVSSVLHRNVREFGAAHMFDGSSDSCWNSDQGTPQWIVLRFLRPVLVCRLLLMFQGGFAGKEMQVRVTFHTPPLSRAPLPASSPIAPSADAAATPCEHEHTSPPPSKPRTSVVNGKDSSTTLQMKSRPMLVGTFYPDDDNKSQSFELTAAIRAAAQEREASVRGAERDEDIRTYHHDRGPEEGEEGFDCMCKVVEMKLTFNGSSDFYGRVTLYRLAVWGLEEDQAT